MERYPLQDLAFISKIFNKNLNNENIKQRQKTVLMSPGKAFLCLLTLSPNGSVVVLSEVYGHKAHAGSHQEHKQQDQTLLQGGQTILGHVYFPSKRGRAQRENVDLRTMWFTFLYRKLWQCTASSEL